MVCKSYFNKAIIFLKGQKERNDRMKESHLDLDIIYISEYFLNVDSFSRYLKVMYISFIVVTETTGSSPD